MKRTKKKKYATCPSCHQPKHRTEIRIIISEMEKTNTNASFIDSEFEWACDSCLETKKAIKANPSQQNYCWYPYYAYSDSKSTCRTCETEFVFSKEEKKFWFESLKFWIDSTPVNCVNCRKEVRQLKMENKILSEILRKEETAITLNELERVIEIYTKWEKGDRVKYYQSILKRRNK